MNTSVQSISLSGLILAFIPTLMVLGILFRWSLNARTALYAVARMLIQLLLIGYILIYIFNADHPGIIVSVVTVMLVAASWIALRPLKNKLPHLYWKALGAIFLGGIPTLALVTQVVLDIQPWFLPRYFIPLAGMIFASCMNTVSVAAERFEAECANAMPYTDARNTALQVALIPVTNSLFAVGLVSLPGMMTGQILSGISPLVAAQYQIVVMCMIFGASGMSATIYLLLAKRPS
ncbi:MAG: ABC transporter permease [Nitrospirales bacterium]|nr:MAG: ABC transporter permease [Nitrospirales bacterium]